MAEEPTVVRIDGAAITDSESFHSQFAAAFGFPDFCGRNMNAWIDCLSQLDDPTAGMTHVHLPRVGTPPLNADVNGHAPCTQN